MDLPDCPPGTEGYEEDVTKMSRHIVLDKHNDTSKAEREFIEHLDSLKLRLEDGTLRKVVESRNRDASGKIIYLCFPCAATCSGESMLQNHMLGKKHKNKLSSRTTWPVDIYVSHPYELDKKIRSSDSEFLELEQRFGNYRKRAAIQDTLDELTYPILGLEYLLEFPPEEEHHERRYLCVLCQKQGHPRTIINHVTCFWHRFSYLSRHFPKAAGLLAPYTRMTQRNAVSLIMNRLSKCIEDKHGRMKPLLIDYDVFEKEKEKICQWIYKSPHAAESPGATFEEIVDVDLITTLRTVEMEQKDGGTEEKQPDVRNVQKKNIRTRLLSTETVSDDSEDDCKIRHVRDGHSYRDRRYPSSSSNRYEPYPRHKMSEELRKKVNQKEQQKDYKLKLASEKRKMAEDSAKKMLIYHEKNPEKHPLYPDEWKKFWNRRYKELQAEGKDPSKHDFKPEWIVYWTKRMKELHMEELQENVNEIYRKLCLPAPNMHHRQSPQPDSSSKRSSTERRRLEDRHRSPGRPRMPRSRSAERIGSDRHRSREYRRSPYRQRPDSRRMSPESSSRYSRSRQISRSPRSRDKQLSPLSRRSHDIRSHNPIEKSLVLQTVLVSDDDMKESSQWLSDSMESLGSLPEAKSPEHSSHKFDPLPTFENLGPADDVVGTLRILVALEDNLGSLGPKIVDVLTAALKMEKDCPNSSEKILDNEVYVTLLETAKEKLKGAVQAGLVTRGEAAARAAVVRVATLLHHADTRNAKNKQNLELSNKAGTNSKENQSPTTKPELDRAKIAKEIAAVLIAQGKTDISSEELEILVDSVVQKANKKKEVLNSNQTPEEASAKPSQKTTPSASALQLLQFAYDEDKKAQEKDKASDAMDGLSDSDLEMLLKNFNELSAEEQHSLIAYLKKLEAHNPKRVERLREYVSLAAPVPNLMKAETTAPEPAPQENKSYINVDSDDDDYTVDEVFQSATQKVKEDKIRQELEVVKKSLEEAKTVSEDVMATTTTAVPTIPVIPEINMSSAANLLAIVQATIQANSKPHSDIKTPEALIDTNTHPISFGDRPQQPMQLMSLPISKPQPFSNSFSGAPLLGSFAQNSVNEADNNSTSWGTDAKDFYQDETEHTGGTSHGPYQEVEQSQDNYKGFDDSQNDFSNDHYNTQNDHSGNTDTQTFNNGSVESMRSFRGAANRRGRINQFRLDNRNLSNNVVNRGRGGIRGRRRQGRRGRF